MKRNRSGVLVGDSVAMREVREEIDRVAKSDAKVLITGESGVGKELVAREIHRRSARVEHPFVAVNCAGLPETLLESELFGHVRGSFTGAYRDKPGKLEIADQGIILLDEVGEMTLRMQGLLLRFLETGELQKVGAERGGRLVNVRVIAATNRKLRDMIGRGEFREDLYYRLNVIHLVIPPLRERRDDIPLLVEHFLQELVNDTCVPHAVSVAAIDAMRAYNWPGNIRELENVLERLVVTGRKPVIDVDDLPLEVRAEQRIAQGPIRERRRTVVDDLYQRLLNGGESFWTIVYPLYMQREITRHNVRELVRRGLQDARGNYKIVTRMFNMSPDDYKRFLNFLRKHDCQLPFKEYR